MRNIITPNFTPQELSTIVEWDSEECGSEGYTGYQTVEPRTVEEALALPEWRLHPLQALTEAQEMLIARSRKTDEVNLLTLAKREDTSIFTFFHLLTNERTPQGALTVIAQRLEGVTASRVIVRHSNCGLAALKVVAERELSDRRDKSVLHYIAEHPRFCELLELLIEDGRFTLPEGWTLTEEQTLGLRSHISPEIASVLEAYGEAA
ncbi:hypothetical protein ICM05_05355 [Leucobacter sp. cx-42]|uniref:hypothetical protein n=1 Tax=unclassified Leucobacter TaxID=2621730 RepID=UPI00165DE916|nr:MULTISPECIES: hypothetical protein [unclassified Leucobacter]MBC9954073.1 hypothetical protein [Leucobacter sp. cx-42]